MTMLVDPRVISWYHLQAGAEFMNAGRYREGLAQLNEAIRIDPTDARSHFNKGMCLLQLGDYPAGWHELEWRFAIFDWRWGYLDKSVERLPQIREWRGEPLGGKRLLVYHEQGHGDNIMMMRYIPQFVAEGARVSIWTLAALAPLFNYCFPEVDVITELPADLSTFDYRTPTFGVMTARDQFPDCIPSIPKLDFDFSARGPSIGVAWSGVTQKVYKGPDFIRMLDSRGRALAAVQLGAVPDGVVPCPARDFFDLAVFMTTLEHIVTVDTAAVHLAGTIGHPSVHLLLPALPDWRWQKAQAWYPNVHIHRSFDEVNKAIN